MQFSKSLDNLPSTKQRCIPSGLQRRFGRQDEYTRTRNCLMPASLIRLGRVSLCSDLTSDCGLLQVSLEYLGSEVYSLRTECPRF